MQLIVINKIEENGYLTKEPFDERKIKQSWQVIREVESEKARQYDAGLIVRARSS